MAKKMIRPIRSETEYDEALEEIERYFESEPKPGTPEADRFDLLALIIEDHERKRWPIDPPRRLTRSVTAWKRPAILKPTWVACSAHGSAHPTS